MTLRLTSPQAAMVSSSAALMDAIGLLEPALDDAVELEGLPRGEPERAVGVLARQPVHGEPLRRRAHATGYPHADHEAVGRLEALLLPLVAQVPVVLLVDAVELGELRVRFGEGAGGLVRESLQDRPAKSAAVFLMPSTSTRAGCRAELIGPPQ
jgi:hypothetical protein